MTSKSPEFCQFRRASKLQALRRRSRSAANVTHATTDDPDDADFDWDMRRRSANYVPSTRLSTSLQKRLIIFGRAAPVAVVHGPATVASPTTQGANSGSNERPCNCCDSAATSSSADVLCVTPGYDCKYVSCPELIDSPSNSASVKQRCDVGLRDNKPPRHQAVRKTCSDTSFKPAAMTSDTEAWDKQPLLSVPTVFVTSYTRSAESQSRCRHQQLERRQSASLTGGQRLMSMSDSRLGNSDCFTTLPPTPSSAARIWKLTEFLCIGNEAAAINDRILCRHSVLGLIGPRPHGSRPHGPRPHRPLRRCDNASKRCRPLGAV